MREETQYSTFPFRLYQKAKKLGIWNPIDIDLSQDIEDWKKLSKEDKNYIRVLLSKFVTGEELVTLELLPLIHVIAAEHRVDEVMYLTTFLFEEAKHTEFFNRILEEVTHSKVLGKRLYSEEYKKLFFEELPMVMGRLQHDSSPEAIAIAATTYNIVAEGVIAEAGYQDFFHHFSRPNRKPMMPGLVHGFNLVKLDESRHISYGTYLLQRLIREHGERIRITIEKQISKLAPYCIGIVGKRAIKMLDIRLEILKKDID